jgi:hypothetical protein
MKQTELERLLEALFDSVQRLRCGRDWEYHVRQGDGQLVLIVTIGKASRKVKRAWSCGDTSSLTSTAWGTLGQALARRARRHYIPSPRGRLTAWTTAKGSVVVMPDQTVRPLPPAGHQALLALGDDRAGRLAVWDMIEEEG